MLKTEAFDAICKAGKELSAGVMTFREFESQVARTLDAVIPVVRNPIQRPAIKNPGGVCQELNCAAMHRDHQYGEKGCSWVKLINGEIMSRAEANATSSRPDRAGQFK